MILAWHFVRGTGDDMKLRDGRTAVVGEWLEHAGSVEICQTGLHASYRAFDALDHVQWDGGSACMVEVDGVVTEQADKFVCTRRRILFAVPCDEILRAFSRQCALSVLHLWEVDVPPVVGEFLETGNEGLRAAAGAAAGAAAWAAAWAAAGDAARAAARAAAWAAAGDAARAAARAAAWAVARAAAGAAKISDLNATLESLFLAAAIQEGFDPELLQ